MHVPSHVWKLARKLGKVDRVILDGQFWYALLPDGRAVKLCKDQTQRKAKTNARRLFTA